MSEQKPMSENGSALTLMQGVLDKVYTFHEQRGVQQPALPFDALENLVTVHREAWFGVIVGAPGMGRSALLQNIVPRTGLEGQRLVYSTDLPPEMLMMRVLHSEARVDGNRTRRGALNERDFERLVKAAGRLAELPLTVLDAYDMTAAQMADHALAAAQEGPVALVAVDGIELGPDVDLDAAVLRLRKLSRELSCPVILTFPLNLNDAKGSERWMHRPILSHITLSERLAGAADCVIGVFRPEYYNPETDLLGVMELIVLKQRSGPVGTVKVHFHAQHVRLDDLARESVQSKAASTTPQEPG